MIILIFRYFNVRYVRVRLCDFIIKCLTVPRDFRDPTDSSKNRVRFIFIGIEKSLIFYCLQVKNFKGMLCLYIFLIFTLVEVTEVDFFL